MMFKKVIFKFKLLVLFFIVLSCDQFQSNEHTLSDESYQWSGSEVKFEQRFKNKDINGSYLFFDLHTDLPFTGSVQILNNDNSPWLRHNYSEGIENGERIVWQNGKVYGQYLYDNGKLTKTIIKQGKSVK